MLTCNLRTSDKFLTRRNIGTLSYPFVVTWPTGFRVSNRVANDYAWSLWITAPKYTKNSHVRSDEALFMQFVGIFPPLQLCFPQLLRPSRLRTLR